MPKILELFLPKKILAPIKNKFESKGSRNGSISETTRENSSNKPAEPEPGNMNRNDLKEECKDDSALFLTAPSTLRRKKKTAIVGSSTESDKKIDSGGQNKNLEDVKNSGSALETDIENGTPADGSTSDLLNRVLKAIQKLEQEQSILLKNVPPSEIAEEDLIPKTDDLNAKSLSIPTVSMTLSY